MSTIFISHSSRDNDLAKELARRLSEQHHHSVFLDLDPEKGIVAGQSWERTLYRKLRACRAVIALCTDNYISSQWCFAEVALARMEGKHIIALKADPLSSETRMPAILGERQFIDLRVDPEDGYRRLWRGLKEEDLLGVAGDWDPNKSPYLGLSAFQEEHASVFFGREEETRAGLELLDRGAPGFIMVLGASGSGKSSLVRAGMLPRLRREPTRWLVLDPVRPGSDPFIELAQSIDLGYRRFAEQHRRDRHEIVGSLVTPQRPSGAALRRVSAEFGFDVANLQSGDDRLNQLVEQLEELRNSPPAHLSGRLRDLLDESLLDLQRVVNPAAIAEPSTLENAATTPLIDLVEHLRRGTEDRRHARVLLVVDQFEELLGHEDVDHPANKFLSMLRASVEAQFSPLTVLGTMRSDFLGSFQRNPATLGMDFESLSVGPMSVEGMRRVIEQPARLGAIELEDGLADRLLADAETSDALPLLSFTLWKLWRDFRGHGRFELRGYEGLGGLQGALVNEADVILESARKSGRVDALRTALIQLARVTEDGVYARRPVAWDDGNVTPAHDLLDRFIDRRLLVVRVEGESRIIEVCHEALFRAWAPLAKWLDDHRSELLLLAQLRRDAVAWDEESRNDDSLWRGGRLQQANELARTRDVPPVQRAFITAGVARRQRQRWAVALGTATVMIGLAGAALFSLVKRNEAEHARARALDIARVAVAGQWISRDPNLAALVLNEVTDPAQTPFATLRMREALNAGLSTVLLGHESPVVSARFSPDGLKIVTASADGTARVYRSDGTGEPTVLDPYPEDVAREVPMVSASFSPDGARVLTASEDGTARVWDVASGTQHRVLEGHELPVLSARFSSDGRYVVTTSEDRTARIWAVEGSDEPVVLVGHESFAVAGTFDHVGQTVATASHDQTARIWDIDGNPVAVLRGHTGELLDLSLSPNGELVATGSMDGTARLWDRSGQPIHVLRGHDGPVETISFSADGSKLVTSSRDHTARVWTVNDSVTSVVLAGHADTLVHAAFSGSGDRVITSSHDGTARVWNAATGAELFSFPWHGGRVLHAEFSPDGQTIVTASSDLTARVWQAAGKSDPATVATFDLHIDAGAVSPDGRLAAGVSTGAVSVWSVAQPGTIRRLGQHARATLLRFSPDSRFVTSADESGRVRVWDVSAGEEIRYEWLPARSSAIAYNRDASTMMYVSRADSVTIHVLGGVESVSLGEHFNVTAAVFLPDGRTVATASYDSSVTLWDLSSSDAMWTRVLDAPVITLVVSPSGGDLVAATDGNVAFVLDAQTGATRATLTGHTASITSVSFSHDGARIVTASRDGSARVWSLEGTDQPVILFDDTVALVAAWFEADTDAVFTLSANGTVRRWTTTSVTGLQAALRASSNLCLPVEFRTQFLGEEVSGATEAHDACVSAGRTSGSNRMPS